MSFPFPYPVVDDEQVRANFESLSLSWPIQAQTALSLLNGWQAQASWAAPKAVRYGNIVTLNGVFNGLAGPATNAQVATLPVGYRPTGQVGGAVSYWTGAARALGTVAVQASGAFVLLGIGDGLTARDSYIVSITFSVL